MSECKILYNNNIINVSKSGLEYIDDSGKIGYIDFDECRKNWVEYVKKSDEFSNRCNIEDSVCIGWRDICGAPPYIEFFSIPRITLIFPYKRVFFKPLTKLFFNISYKKFSEIQNSIIKNGWRTFDLS